MILEALRRFKLSAFRGEQESIINAVMQGGGKSLTFQLPATLHEGITIVVSPLIALIQNQIEALAKLAIPAATLNSTLKATERLNIINDLESASPRIKLLYVTPELLATVDFRQRLLHLHQRSLIARLVIDEAHCISEWGHNFRPDYRKLGSLKELMPGLSVMALTATATDRVKQDIIKQLHMQTPQIFTSSFDRPNLYYEVRFKPTHTNDPFSDILNLLETFYTNREKRIVETNANERKTGVCGIIYCATRAQCDIVAQMLNKKDIKAASYHAGLTSKQRKSILERWTETDAKLIQDLSQIIDIVVATISFGMGIDKKCVRFVIHWDLPKSFESYYQESGRAGRDGKVSRCILYYSQQDMERAKFLLGKDVLSAGSEHSFQHLIEYCQNFKICRHEYIKNYFVSNRDVKAVCDKRCDICRHPQRVKENVLCSIYENSHLSLSDAHEASKILIEKSTVGPSFKRPRGMYTNDPCQIEHDQKMNQDFGGFQKASDILKNSSKTSQEMLFENRKRTKIEPDPDYKPIYSIIRPLDTLKGQTRKQRDDSVARIIKALNKNTKLDSKETEAKALEIEGQFFGKNTVGLVYQANITQYIRKMTSN